MCDNYDLCENTSKKCIECNALGLGKLEFKNTEEECVLCYESVSKIMKFPANCGHWFCIGCSRSIIYFDETTYHISPVTFGCPPCGCNNPPQGRQCLCDKYCDIVDSWLKSNPTSWNLWIKAEEANIRHGSESYYGSRKCPMCRKKC